ncbi:MAG TPA: MFS transporter, partial [Streptosporangiaceae bacterium]|nr:MFS transporter [Streptosporangiaceae bacterium]
LPSGVLGQARSTLGDALSAAGKLHGQAGADLVDAARAAFAHGLDYAALGAASAMILAAVLTIAFMRGIRSDPASVPAAQLAEPAREKLPA